jgi:hypothetical protein
LVRVCPLQPVPHPRYRYTSLGKRLAVPSPCVRICNGPPRWAARRDGPVPDRPRPTDHRGHHPGPGPGGIATIALLQQRTAAHSEVERSQLQHALTSRIVLEQAKGILAERWHVTVDEAFAAFRAYARAHQRKLAELAREIADGTFDTTDIPQPGRSTPQS